MTKCEDCQQERDDVVVRWLYDSELESKGRNKGDKPALCTACCAQYPSRGWMKSAATC